MATLVFLVLSCLELFVSMLSRVPLFPKLSIGDVVGGLGGNGSNEHGNVGILLSSYQIKCAQVKIALTKNRTSLHMSR